MLRRACAYAQSAWVITSRIHKVWKFKKAHLKENSISLAPRRKNWQLSTFSHFSLQKPSYTYRFDIYVNHLSLYCLLMWLNTTTVHISNLWFLQYRQSRSTIHKVLYWFGKCCIVIEDKFIINDIGSVANNSFISGRSGQL